MLFSISIYRRSSVVRGSNMAMLNHLQTRMLQSLVVISLLTLPALGVQWKTRIANVPKMFLTSPVNSNYYNYSSILNSPDLCGSEGGEVLLLILVRSIPQNILRRQSIRNTWGAVNEVQQKGLKVAFLFGNHEPVFNKLLKEEHTKHQDILQDSFNESYATLHVKTVMAWKWAVTFCPKTMFVIVCNDETFVDIFKVVSYLKERIATKQHEDLYGCWMEKEGNNPYRNLKHRHGVSWKDYPGRKYPAFCNGNGYVASLKIIRKLYQVSLDTPGFMPDDAWSGVLAAKLSLVISNIHDQIPIATHYKIIEQYQSLEQYIKTNMLFYPLDRKFSSCEVCASHYLWRQIALYNDYKQTPLKSVYVPHRMTHNIFQGAVLFLYVSFILNFGIFIGFYSSKKKRLPLLLFVCNILIITLVRIVTL